MYSYLRRLGIMAVALLVSVGLTTVSAYPAAMSARSAAGPCRPAVNLRTHGDSGAANRPAQVVPAGLMAALQRTLHRSDAGSPTWTQQAELTATNGLPNDNFGGSVALSGTTAIIAAYGRNSSTGAAYVFVRNGAVWSQQAMLTASDGAPGDNFGYSVTLWGNTVVIGASGHNGSTGAAYVFVRRGTRWTQQAELTAADGMSGDNFGFAASLWGNTVIIGAYGKNATAGAAYVFVRAGTTWSQQGVLTAADGAGGDNFGGSVAVWGNTVAIGAPGKNTSTGVAYVFVRTGTTWSQQAELTGMGGLRYDYFGGSMAMWGNTVAIGAPGKGRRTGAAYIFVRNGTTWSQQAMLYGADGAINDSFGFSVALWGNMVAIGAYTKNIATGATYVFVRSGTTWTQQAELFAADAAQYSSFGFAVALWGRTVLVGATGNNNFAGAAYAFVY